MFFNLIFFPSSSFSLTCLCDHMLPFIMLDLLPVEPYWPGDLGCMQGCCSSKDLPYHQNYDATAPSFPEASQTFGFFFSMRSLRWFCLYITTLRHPSALCKGIQHLEISISFGILLQCHLAGLHLCLVLFSFSLYRILLAWHEMKVEQSVTRGQYIDFSKVIMLKKN